MARPGLVDARFVLGNAEDLPFPESATAPESDRFEKGHALGVQVQANRFAIVKDVEHLNLIGDSVSVECLIRPSKIESGTAVGRDLPEGRVWKLGTKKEKLAAEGNQKKGPAMGAKFYQNLKRKHNFGNGEDVPRLVAEGNEPIALGDGARGTPAYTHLERTSQPMIRLLSGDLTRWEPGPSPCGRTYPQLPDGIFGRIDDAFTIRGENGYPSEIDSALNEMADYGGEHRIIISREGARDELFVQVEGLPIVYHQGREERLRDAAAFRLHQMLGIRTEVEVVEHGSIPRTDFKARRVVDDREEFRQMQQRLERS